MTNVFGIPEDPAAGAQPRAPRPPAPSGHEQVVFCHDAPTGLRAIIAIYSTALGPSLGGTRFYPYPSEEAALADDDTAGKAHSVARPIREAQAGSG